MATANTKSDAITNADATPRVQNNSWVERSPIYVSTGICEVAAADDDTSVYRFVRVPSGAKIHKIEIYNDAITGGTDYNLGVLHTAANGGAAVDDNLFGDALDLSSAQNGVDVTYEAEAIDDGEDRLWEQLGLSVDPFTEYDIALTSVTVGTAAGTILLKVYWSE